MNCKEVENILADALYDEMDDHQHDLFKQHLSACPACQAEYDSLKETMSRLDQCKGLEEPFQLSQITRATLSPEKTRSKPMYSIRPILIGSVAAMLMFGLLRVGEFSLSNQKDTPPSPSQGTVEMEQFVLLLFEDTNSEAAMNPEKEKILVKEYSQWAGNLAQVGQLVGGEKLKNQWSRVLQGHGQQFTFKDGFQTRDREMISGFFQILAKSYDEAMEIAKTCPHLKYNGRIELRWIDPV